MGIRTRVGRSDGRARFNAPDDVDVVKRLLLQVDPQSRLIENGQIDAATIDSIERFQGEVVRLRNPDGWISPRGRTWNELLSATSDSRFRMLVQRCAARPRFADLQTAYESYRADSAPCKAGVTNQCAVRMSIALARAGIGMEGFPDQRRVHRGRRRCSNSIPHVLGANELARHLTTVLGQPQRFRRSDAAPARRQLQNQRGIIYFDNCYAKEGKQVGDHIDLWTGSRYHNDIFRVPAGGDAKAGAALFRRAQGGVWFWSVA